MEVHPSPRRWLPEAVLALSLILLFHRLLVGEVIFWGTPLLQFYPWRDIAFARLQAGELPLWNPMLGNGAPLLANYQTAVFYPPNWLYLVIPTEYAMGLVGVLHIFWAGLGMITYLSSLGTDRTGQGIGALAYSLSGYLIARFGFLSMTGTVAWLPWLIWAVDRTVLDQKNRFPRRVIALLAVIVAMALLAGHAQTATYSLALAALYALWRAFATYGPKASITPLIYALLGVVLGMGVAAIQLVPTFELMQNSQRAAGLDREIVMTYSFWPWRFLSLLSPNIFGSPVTGDYWGYANYWEDAIYLGLLPLVLTVKSVRRWLNERRNNKPTKPGQVVPFYATLILPVLLLALGNNTSVFPWLYDHVPGFDLFQAPTRITLLAVFGLAVLGAVGADGWQTTARGRSWSRRWMAAGLSILLGALYARFMLPGMVQESFIHGVGRLGLMIVLVGALALALRRAEWQPGWRPWWEAAALGLLAGDLVTAHWGLNPTIQAAFYHQPSSMAEALAGNLRGARTLYLPDDEYEAKFRYAVSFTSFQADNPAHWHGVRNSLLPNLGMIDGVPSANNFDPLLVGSADALLQSLSDLPAEGQVEAARRMGVGVLLTTKQRAGREPLAVTDPIFAYEIPGPWPRVALADCAEMGLAAQCEPRKIGSAEIMVDEPEYVVVSLSADTPAHLLLLDTYYPGWEARLDGRPVPILRAGSAFRAVQVPSGQHELAFLYRPASLYIGLAITGLGLVLILTLWVRRLP